jgi:hypothetical protein
MISLMNMSDIYVEYQVSSNIGGPNVIRVFAQVPRAKIEAYRQAQNTMPLATLILPIVIRAACPVEIPPPSLAEFG